MMADAIRVEGLAEFSRKLKRLDSQLPKALRIALNQAADVIIGAAQPQVPTRTGRARASIKARSTRTMVRVSAGGSKAPYYPWLDFGGKVGIGRSVERPFYKKGRYIYRGYEDKQRSGEFPKILRKVLIAEARRAGFEVD